MKTLRTILAIFTFFALLLVASLTPLILATIDTFQDREVLINSMTKTELLTKSEFISVITEGSGPESIQFFKAQYEVWGLGDTLESITIRIINGVYDWLETDKELNIKIDLFDEFETSISQSLDKQFLANSNSDLPACSAEQEEEIYRQIIDSYLTMESVSDVDEFSCKLSANTEIKEMYKEYAQSLFIGNMLEIPEGEDSIESVNTDLVVDYETLGFSEEAANGSRDFYQGLGRVKVIILVSLVSLATFGILLMPDRKTGFFIAAGVVGFVLISYLPILFITRESFVFPPDPDPITNYLLPFLEEYLYAIMVNMKPYVLMQIASVIILIASGIIMGKSQGSAEKQRSTEKQLGVTPVDPAMEEKAFVKE